MSKGVNSNTAGKGVALKLVIHIIVGFIIVIMLAGILAVLTLPISGKSQVTLVAWGILLAIIGAIFGALFAARNRGKN